jgi:hypothetical protein
MPRPYTEKQLAKCKAPELSKCVACGGVGSFHISEDIWLCNKQACRDAWHDANDPQVKISRAKRN